MDMEKSSVYSLFLVGICRVIDPVKPFVFIVVIMGQLGVLASEG